MKTNIFKYTFLAGFCVFLIACSTRKNSFLSRNSHALSTEYNILYNGGIALDKGVEELKTTYKDNFWERLPVERMQVTEDAMIPGQTKNPNFDRAETKAIKAIQKHSMNIDGNEVNPQMDEAHLMLGKARYYDQRFVPALEAFNYILYKYPQSDKIYEAKVWREKTNIRMDNDALAVKNLRKLLKEIKFKDQIFADANAIMAEAFLNLEEKDSAVAKLKIATHFTKQNEEKARYRFILAQLYDDLGYKDSAYAAYQSVIDMKRKSPRQYVIHAHAKQALQFDAKTGDTLAFLKKYHKLLADRENRPYLDVLNHQMGLFYDKAKNDKLARKYYNASLKTQSQDQYLVASNYRNLADIYFNDAKYVAAGQYYDSTLVQLKPRSREYKLIKKKRENLVDVIKYEAIAQVNDSILHVVAMTEPERKDYYEDYIGKLKKQDEIKKNKEEKEREAAATAAQSGNNFEGEDRIDGKSLGTNKEPDANAPDKPGVSPPGAAPSQEGIFYFYNPTTVAFGKVEFRKIWGDRAYTENWRISSGQSNVADTKTDTNDNTNDGQDVADSKEAVVDPRYTTDFYTSRLPKTQKEIDSLAKDRNFAYYQLGVIYKEKFREYKLAAAKLEKLLENNPEERLVLPTLYNLYKIYEIIDQEKAIAMKERVISQYPASRYAQILGSANSESVASLTPEAAYNNLFKRYENADYKAVLAETETAIDQYTGDESVAKFELLKARIIGKLRGLEEYKKALNFVALNYPNSPEGKEAESLLGTDIPALANLQFSNSETFNWKILYPAKTPEDKGTKYLMDKIKKFLTERKIGKLSTSFDIYTEQENFVVIHGMTSEESAKGIASVLKEFKEYKVPDTPIIISGQNYEIVQMKKNIAEYLANPVMNPKSVTEQLPAKVHVPVPTESDVPKQKPIQNPRGSQNPADGQKQPQGQVPPMTVPGKNNAPGKDQSTPPGFAAPPSDPRSPKK